jgi:hypothetical protein
MLVAAAAAILTEMLEPRAVLAVVEQAADILTLLSIQV